jgi:DNA invertase Pin-like site-specific DNA recombinase
MKIDQHHKVNAGHLKRLAYLYVRQSTLRQVFENTESTRRQYALRERAVALGWPLERIVVIDSDLGQSGADSDREGFQKLVAAVGMGEVGVVLGLEVSRLARSSVDWHRLLEICALTGTLILDEDGLYDPSHFNDRLLLGLKGTMSEAELHVLRASLIGGQLAKASRGDLEIRLPVGLVYSPDGKVVLDPDQQVQQAESWCGAPSCITERCGFSRTLATLAPSPMAGAKSAGPPTGVRSSLGCRGRSGRLSSWTPTPATSPGSSTKRTCADCATMGRPTVPTGATARAVRDRPPPGVGHLRALR